MNLYRGFVELEIPVYCIAENDDEAFDKFHSNLYKYIQDTVGDIEEYVREYARLKAIEFEKEIEEEKPKKSLFVKGVDAAAKFLRNRGYNVYETYYGNDGFNIVCTDVEEGIVFVNVSVHSSFDEDCAELEFDRSAAERKAGVWLLDNLSFVQATDNMKVRFDEIAVLVVGEERALLRHHIDAGGEA